MTKPRGVVFDLLRQSGIRRRLQRLIKRLLCGVVLPCLEQDVCLQLQVTGHIRGIVVLLRDRILLLDLRERLVQLTAIDCHDCLTK